MFKDAKKIYLQRIEKAKTYMEELGQDAAKMFVRNAKKETTVQRLVKTGNYRRSWTADVEKKGLDTLVKCINEAEYASHLEYGHRIVTRTGKDTGKKTRGRFVGRYAVNQTREKIRYILRNITEKVVK